MSFGRSLIRLANFRPLCTRSPQNVISIRAVSTVVHDLPHLKSILQTKVETKNVSGIHSSYPALVAALKQSGIPSSSNFTPLSRSQVLALLEVLATSGRPQDLQRIEEIFRDLNSVFGIQPDHEFHTVVIRGLITYGNVQTIHRWLLQMPLRPGQLNPTVEHFHMFLESCLHLTTFKYTRHVVKTMRQTGCKPTNDTFKFLIRALWLTAVQEERPLPVTMFSVIFDDMKLENLPYDDSIAGLLRDQYEQRGLEEAAGVVQSLYSARFLSGENSAKLCEVEWISKLSQVAQSQGLKTAMNLIQSSTSKDASPAAIRAVLRHSIAIDDLYKVREAFDVGLDPAYWSILVNNNTRAGNVAAALSIYKESKQAGVKPDAALVGPLIKSLCRSVGQPLSDESLETALSIYRDLASAVPPSTPARPKESYDDHSAEPDIGIYNDLLRGLASSSNAEKYHSVAKTLLEDMDARKITTEDSITASSLIVLYMRRASSIEDALDVYYQFRSSLDEKGYAVVLNTFCSLSFGGTLEAPSMADYFELVKDMRRAGLEITVEVYTILLHRLGLIATKLRDLDVRASQDLRDALITTTRRTHDFLTLDAAVSPDAHVWNQLMNTYQRLGCFADAYKVWETMYLSGRFDHVSVSIILDACGFAGEWPVAKRICQQLFKDRFSFNLHNWNTWIECLCRLRRLNDAVKVVCMEMGKQENTVAPDVESVRILIKFARRDGLYEEVAQRLEQHTPELWKVLPEDLHQP